MDPREKSQGSTTRDYHKSMEQLVLMKSLKCELPHIEDHMGMGILLCQKQDSGIWILILIFHTLSLSQTLIFQVADPRPRRFSLRGTTM